MNGSFIVVRTTLYHENGKQKCHPGKLQKLHVLARVVVQKQKINAHGQAHQY